MDGDDEEEEAEASAALAPPKPVRKDGRSDDGPVALARLEEVAEEADEVSALTA
jgi:hypothetical protein